MENCHVKIINNPIEIVLQAFRDICPCTRCKVQFSDAFRPRRILGLKFGYAGVTIFPKAGGPPLIEISVHIPFHAIPEVLAHELAHVIVRDYEKDPHGEAWRVAFDAIHKRYIEIVKAKLREV